MNPRRGFALLAVLWVVVLLGTISSTSVLRARDGQDAAARYSGTMRGKWAAAACLAVIKARIEEALRASGKLLTMRLDTLALENGSFCIAEAEDPGARVHDTMPALIARLDSLLASRERTRDRARLRTSAGDGRINVPAAPAEVLLALPGMTDDAVRAIEEARRWSRMPNDLGALLASLPPGPREALAGHYQELLGLTSFGATSLAVTATGWHPAGPPVRVEQLVVNGGSRAAIVYQRLLP